jgi:hypothetical protein
MAADKHSLQNRDTLIKPTQLQDLKISLCCCQNKSHQHLCRICHYPFVSDFLPLTLESEPVTLGTMFQGRDYALAVSPWDILPTPKGRLRLIPALSKSRRARSIVPKKPVTVNQHLPVHHPLDACYDSVVDDPQLSYYPVSSW